MKTEIKYICEICNAKYQEEESALACEARGVEIACDKPIGLIYGNHQSGEMYHNCTFAVAQHYRGDWGSERHRICFNSWACRENVYGDSLGNDKCEGSDLNEWYAHLNPETPHFKRMVTYLESNDIPVTVWNGKRPVPLQEWLQNKKG